MIAEVEGEIVGYIIGAITHNDQKGWILSIAVKMSHRNKGIATILIQSILNLFSKYKIMNIYLTVNPENSHIIKFYQKLGFDVIETIKNYCQRTLNLIQVI